MRRGSRPLGSRARGSLERRLPLLIFALVSCVIAALGSAAYREVRVSAIERTSDRLAQVAREVTTAAGRTTALRFAALRALGDDPVVARAVATGGDAAVRAVSGVAATRLPADSTTVAWELWSAEGTRRAANRPVLARDSTMLASVRTAAVRSDAVQRSPLFGAGEEVHHWTVAPVRVSGRVVGTYAELRRLGNSLRSEQMIRELTGEDVRVLYTSRGSAEWATLAGRLTPAPFPQLALDDSVVRLAGAGGTHWYAVQAAIPGTPWLVVLLESEAAMLRRPNAFLRRMLIWGSLLLAAATLAAWLLSRHVTQPLRGMTDAADALAHGDYARRIPVHGSAELAALADRFNLMAAAIGEAHAALADRNVQLHRANEAKAQFLAMMSHELRTPLNAIAGYTELLELGLRGPVTQAQVEDLARIRRNKDHLLSIISDILGFSRADAGALALRREDVALADVLSDAVDALGHQFAVRDVRLRIAPVPAGAIVHADREKVQQVLLNLLANALNFTDARGEVSVTTTVAGDVARLEVRDTGIGIAPERLADIFEPFVQVDAALTRRVGGTGLGLAIVHDLTTAMGGTVGVTSVVGQGSCFTVTLPRWAEAGEAGEAGVTIGQGATTIATPPPRGRLSPGARRSSLLVAFATLAALAAAPVAAQGAPGAPGGPGARAAGGARPALPRPPLAAGADTNDWEAYYDHGVKILPGGSRDAEAAFYWASRLHPDRAEPLFARWVAFHMRDARRYEDYLAQREYVREAPDVLANDSLRLAAMQRNPFVHQGLEILLQDRMPGRWRDDDLTRAWIAYAHPKFPEATRLLARVLSRDRRRKQWVRGLRAQAFVGMGALDSALAELVLLRAALDGADARELVPVYESKELLDYSIGRLQVARQDVGGAQEAFGRALTENLGFHPAHRWLAELALMGGDGEGAVPALEAALLAAPDDPVLHYRHGLALALAGRWADAGAAQQRATVLEPCYAAPWVALGRALETSGDVAGARAAYAGFVVRAARREEKAIGVARERLAALGAGAAAMP